MNNSHLELLKKLAEEFQPRTDANTRATVETESTDAFATLVDLARDMQDRLDQQQNRIRQLEQLVETDELTGLYNRRGFLRRTREALSRAARQKDCGLLVIADLDGFKEINDFHGHAAGDAVLRHFGQNLRTHTRADDFVARFGGDEFAILMVGSNPDIAKPRIQDLEKATARFPLIWQGSGLPIRASFGFTIYTAQSDVTELLKNADSAMYANKHAKRSPTESNHNAA
tara:strand:+ start:203108 stop:203794 length:687 start_codon:yes stop_codon:yes gene_type:complete